MLINHTTMELCARIVYCGAPGTKVLPTFGNIHQRLDPAMRSPIQTGWAGARHVTSLEFAPANLGKIRGYSLRLLLVGFESTDEEGAPCDLSGFRDVDAVVLVVRRATPAPYLSDAVHQLKGSLEQIGYDFTIFPLVVQLEDGADPNLVTQLIPAPTAPMIAADPVTGEGIFEALKAVTRATLVALKAGQLVEPAESGQPAS